MNQVATATQTAPEQRKSRERTEVTDAVPLLDTARFEHMQRVATVMARSTLMPDSLWKEGNKDNKVELPYEQILSNCFLVVNQAVRWGLDPFAVAQCVSVVHGKLCYEGKLVSAVLQAKMGISLQHHMTGDGEAMRIYLSDKPFTDDIVKLLKPGYRRNDMRIFDGSVAEWKTTGAGTPWTPKNFPRMLIYRGARDWCRIYEPALMLGVYTPDEMVDMEEGARFRSARNVTPAFDPLSDEPVASQMLTRERQSNVEPDTADEPNDALTGEIIDNTNTDEPAPSSSVADEIAPSSHSAEPETAASSVSGSKIPESELPKLRLYAKDLLPRASRPETTGDQMKAIENRWAAEFKQFSPLGKLAAEGISRSMRSIMKDDIDLEQALEFHADGLECTIEDLGGTA